MTTTSNLDWNLGQDQAVMAEVVRIGDSLGHRLGRTALQKVLYFVKRQGVPIRYQFDLHHFGPFCQEILWDAELLVATGVISDSGGNLGGSSYLPGDNFQKGVNEYSDFLKSHGETIERMVNLLAGSDASTLEVAATIDYFYRYVEAAGEPSPRKAAVLQRFYDAKPKYKANGGGFVEKLYDRMAELGMVGK